jgi:hypothetical protein
MVTFLGSQVGWPSGAGDSEPLGTTTGRADGVGLTVGVGVADGSWVGDAVTGGGSVGTAVGVEVPEQPVRTRQKALTATRARLTRGRLRPPLE